MSERSYADTLQSRYQKLRETMARVARGEEVRLYIATGLRDWDENGGIERGLLTVIGAATGDGKSVVKLHLASAAAKAGLRVLMLDFEDPEAKTADRTFSTETGLDSRAIGRLDLDPFQVDQLSEALKAASVWAKRITHHVGLVDVSRALELMREGQWDLVLVDYAQCFPEDDEGSMEKTIRRFSWEANVIAQKQNAAVVVFSQINREVEARGRKQYDQSKWKDPESCDVSGYCPTGLTDIAWAKAMADQAKCLLYLWRPGRIARKLTGNKKVKDNRMKVIVGKANFASEDDMEFEFDGATATLRDLRAA